MPQKVSSIANRRLILVIVALVAKNCARAMHAKSVWGVFFTKESMKTPRRLPAGAGT